METKYCIVQTTVDRKVEAEALAQLILKEKLAACVQINPISSYYTWKGGVSSDSEWLLSIKTKVSCYPELQALIIAHHSYEVPEIIQIPIVDGSEAYLRWVDRNIKLHD